jgi:hypothetical protein
VVASKWPEIREIGVNVCWRPNVFEAVVLCYLATFGIIFREYDDVFELMAEMLVRRMRLDQLTYIDLTPQVSTPKTKDANRGTGRSEKGDVRELSVYQTIQQSFLVQVSHLHW